MALIADVHGNLPALERVVADMAERGISDVVNLGDHVSGPLWPAETADFLMRRSWLTIAGNHDRHVAFDDPVAHGPSDRYAFERLSAAQLRWLAALPSSLTLDGSGLLLCHGIPGDDREYLLETPDHGRLRLARPDEITARLGRTASRIIGCGHSHCPRLVHLSDRVAIVNPGSVGCPAYADSGAQPHISETGSPTARYALIDVMGSDLRVTFVAVEYDHLRAAQQAAANGRPDWALALRTGYVTTERLSTT
jgi:diadenosine tetraphosphatase ApaH/serine/threonine PP2A family protein phosphatase